MVDNIMNFHLDKKISIYIKTTSLQTLSNNMSISEINQAQNEIDDEINWFDFEDEISEEDQLLMDRAIEQGLDDLLQEDIDNYNNEQQELIIDNEGYEAYMATLADGEESDPEESDPEESDPESDDDDSDCGIFANLNREIS